MSSWSRDSDRTLDAELRAARPEPRAEFARATADRVRPREIAGTHRFGHVQLALAGGLTALVLTPVVAAGFGGIGALGKAHTKSGAARVHKARVHTVRSAHARAAALSKRRALASLSRAGATPAAGGAMFAAQNDPGAFFGDIFAPQNNLQAAQVQYGVACGPVIQSNDGTLTQGGNTATGGAATATGGAGGNASTGNTQTNTGAAGTTTSSGDTITFGGDTTAVSGNATGGAGGGATATGGDAIAGNVADQTLVNIACVPLG